MNAEKIVKQATSDGVFIRIALDGKMKAKGEDDVIARWLPLLRQHKTEITKLLLQDDGARVKATRPLPIFCQDNCPGLEYINMQNEGPVAGCLDPYDPNHWQRLDRLTSCPARKRQASHPLPEWCSSSCERYVRLDLPAGIILEWCVTGTNARNWTYVKIDTLAKCSAKQCQQTTTRR